MPDKTRLQFQYTNWRGEDHTYVIEPESIEFATHTQHEGHWVLNGYVLDRDGEDRERGRRSFLLSELRGVEEVLGA